jgi:serine/threonine-protein kinase RsbW
MVDPLEVEHLRIPSRLDRLEEVDTAVERMARAMGFDDSACADLGICATEATTNAMVHAHQQNPALTVEVRLERYPDRICIVVRDHGPGFQPETVPDPTLPENLLKVSGRGLHLIRKLMDEVHVLARPDGVQVVMTKKLIPRT